MKILPPFFCLLLCLSAFPSWADDGKPTNDFLGLQSDPNPFSSQHILEFWGYHDYQGSGDYSNTLRLRSTNQQRSIAGVALCALIPPM